MRQGHCDQALECLKTSLGIHRQVSPELSPETPRLITLCLSSIGELYRLQGKFEEALTTLEDTLNSQRKIPPCANEETAKP